uniref:Uncharacterized protein n=1 Tax=Kalanchoe fedtschenkoi TaxID=63787 RepID=A0A7N0VBD9_KALFE
MRGSLGALRPLWNLIERQHGNPHYREYSKLLGRPEFATSKRDRAQGRALGESSANSSNWVPHPRTGIYFPKGHEWVMEGVPDGAATFEGHEPYWLRNVEGVDRAYPETPTDHYLH